MRPGLVKTWQPQRRSATLEALLAHHGLSSASDSAATPAPHPKAAAGRAPQRHAAESLVSSLEVAACIVEGERIVFSNLAFAQLQEPSATVALHDAQLADFFSPSSISALKAVACLLPTGKSMSPLLQERRQLSNGRWQTLEFNALLLDVASSSLLVSVRPVSKPSELNPTRPSQAPDLREFSDRLLQAREDERRRIARELHDELGQQLSALKISVASLGLCNDLGQVGERTPAALNLIDGIVASTRRIAADLRPLMLDDLGLNAAVEWLTRQVGERSRLRIRLHFDPCIEDVQEPHTTAIYRMVQETLTNVERHAQATAVTVELLCSGTELSLTVSDNGRGFPLGASRKPGSHGLMGLRERARMLGGTLELDNLPGGGASLQVRLPFHRGHHQCDSGRTHR